ncbi:hypothetical protein PG993_004091 [Apiospora rasikravindrae]|uniref:Heterokaryon incompatibility domain-containing protein n=1 Tax=Apiospora rasikravindrae TaxID=990691 RepID=A0ABR1TBT7_9PEZI
MAHLYTYKPIDLSRDAIRLLRLFPPDGDFIEIHCEIFEAFVSDEERLPYEALSYTWGDGVTKTSPTITLSGQKVSVTHNLLDALYHIRQSDRDRILWVDALCINQQDHREKGHQVGQMKSTYEKAEMVLVWLGRSSLEIDELMTDIGKYKDWMNDIAGELRNFNWLSKPLEEVKQMLPTNTLTSCDGTSSLYRQRKATFVRLARRRWFSRLWIVQEVTMAKTATVMCGRRVVASRIFSLIPSLLGIQLRPHAHATLQMMPGWLRRQSPVSQDRRLGTLLRMFQYHRSSDPHDRVYALLGLASDALRFPIDYGIPLPQLALNLAVFLATGSLDHNLTYKRTNVSFQQVLLGLSDPEDFSVFIFGRALRRQEEEFLLLLVEPAQRPQLYRLLHLVSSYPGIDNVTTRLMAHPDLGLEAPNADSNEYKSFVINVDNVQAMAESGPRGYPVQQAEDNTSHANHPGQIEQWLLRMLPLVIQYGDIDVAKALLERARYPYLRHKKQALSSILHSAFMNEDRGFGLVSHAAAELLILHGAEAELPKDGTGPSPLWTAAKAGRLDLVQLCSNHGGNQERTHQGLTPIEAAARGGFYGIVDFLLGLEAQSGTDCSGHQRPLLALASISGQWELFNLLLAKGANTNLKYLNTSPLIAMIDRGQPEGLKLLLEHGVNIEELYEGKTPLYHAVKVGSPSCVRMLLCKERTLM